MQNTSNKQTKQQTDKQPTNTYNKITHNATSTTKTTNKQNKRHHHTIMQGKTTTNNINNTITTNRQRQSCNNIQLFLNHTKRKPPHKHTTQHISKPQTHVTQQQQHANKDKQTNHTQNNNTKQSLSRQTSTTTITHLA